MRGVLRPRRCGHPRTPESTKTNGECRTCSNARQAKYLKKSSVKLRQPKRVPKPIRWIAAPNIPAVIAECRPRYLAAIAAVKPTGRPRSAA